MKKTKQANENYWPDFIYLIDLLLITTGFGDNHLLLGHFWGICCQSTSIPLKGWHTGNTFRGEETEQGQRAVRDGRDGCGEESIERHQRAKCFQQLSTDPGNTLWACGPLSVYCVLEQRWREQSSAKPNQLYFIQSQLRHFSPSFFLLLRRLRLSFSPYIHITHHRCPPSLVFLVRDPSSFSTVWTHRTFCWHTPAHQISHLERGAHLPNMCTTFFFLAYPHSFDIYVLFLTAGGFC